MVQNIMNLEAIKKDLLNSENSSIISTSPPALCTNTSSPGNSSAYECNSLSLESTQDGENLDILEELQNHEPRISDIRTSGTSDERLQGDFCSDTVFNLSNRVLSENELKVLGKGLDFPSIQRKINKPELLKDFEEFFRRIRTKWNFRNEPSQDFSIVPVFSRKSPWKPPLRYPNLEVFLSQVESELFKETQDSLRYSNISQEDCRPVRFLANDRSVVIKKADKGSCVVVWDRSDYIKETD